MLLPIAAAYWIEKVRRWFALPLILPSSYESWKLRDPIRLCPPSVPFCLSAVGVLAPFWINTGETQEESNVRVIGPAQSAGGEKSVWLLSSNQIRLALAFHFRSASSPTFFPFWSRFRFLASHRSVFCLFSCVDDLWSRDRLSEVGDSLRSCWASITPFQYFGSSNLYSDYPTDNWRSVADPLFVSFLLYI